MKRQNVTAGVFVIVIILFGGCQSLRMSLSMFSNCLHGRIDEVRSLAETHGPKAVAAARDNLGSDCLYLAAGGNHVALMELLLSYGANPIGIGTPPLLQAAQEGSVEAMRFLLNQTGVFTNASDWRKKTGLHRAAWSGNAASIDFLLAAGADVNAEDSEGNTPLHLAARWGNAAALASLLAAPEIDVDAVDLEEETPLRKAIRRKNAGVVATLLRNGASLDEAKDCTTRWREFDAGMADEAVRRAVEAAEAAEAAEEVIEEE